MGGVAGEIKCPQCGNENAFGQFEYFAGGFVSLDITNCTVCGYYYERKLVNIKGEFPHINDKGKFDEPLFYVEEERLPIKSNL